MTPHNALLGTIALGGRRERNWCVHNLFICALSHTFGSHIHNLWHRSVDHLPNSALLKTLMESDMHHSDYVFHERMNRNVPVDGTTATITGCLNLAVREISLTTSTTWPVDNGAKPRKNNKNSVYPLCCCSLLHKPRTPPSQRPLPARCIASHKLRGSVPVKNSTSCPAGNGSRCS